MKLRQGFVSNSSSSSFLISKHFISAHQLDQIREHVEVARREGWLVNSVTDREELDCGFGDAWSITENEHEVMGNTWMDNFDMREFLGKIGVDMRYVHFEYGG